jgi:hypothetical protein
LSNAKRRSSRARRSTSAAGQQPIGTPAPTGGEAQIDATPAAAASQRTGGKSGSGRTGTGGTGNTSPSGTARAGRRERQRVRYRQQSFWERYRSWIVIIGAALLIIAAVAFLFISPAAGAYSCSTLMTPAPTVSAAPGASTAIGQPQPDMGRLHVPVGTAVRYTYCPPASGNHYNQPPLGPIPPKYYGPDETTVPQGWVHNLEHGALVVLYSCKNGCPDDATLARLKAFADPSAFPSSPVCGFPAGTNVSPVVTRFDDMATPFAGLVWNRVLFQDTLDTGQLLAFYNQYGERANPELQCTPPSASPSGGASDAPSPVGSPSATASPSPAAPSALPSPASSPSPS